MATFCCNPECVKLLQVKTNRERELILEIQSLYAAIAGLTKRAEPTPGPAPVDATNVDTGIPPGPPMTSLARPDLCKDDFIFKSSPARQGDFNMAYERCDVCARRVQNRMCMACECEVCECACGCEDPCECDECECSRGDHTRHFAIVCDEYFVYCGISTCPCHSMPTQQKMVQGLDEAQAKLNEWAVSHVARVEEGNSKLEDTVSTFQGSLPDPLSPLHGPHPYLRPDEVLPPSPTSSFELEWAPPQCGKQECIDLGSSGIHISTCPYRIGAPPVPSSTTKSDNMWTLDGASGSVVDESTSISPPFPPPLPPPDSQSYTSVGGLRGLGVCGVARRVPPPSSRQPVAPVVGEEVGRGVSSRVSRCCAGCAVQDCVLHG